MTLNSILTLCTLSCCLQRDSIACEKLELTISHQTNLNHLYRNEIWRPVSITWISTQTAFNLLQNNLHFPVQRFCWEIYCEYACSTYEYEYEKIIMPTTRWRKFACRKAPSPSLFPFLFLFFSSYLSSFPLEFTHNFLKFSKRQDFMRTNGKVAHLVIDDRALRKQIAFNNHDAGLHMTL